MRSLIQLLGTTILAVLLALGQRGSAASNAQQQQQQQQCQDFLFQYLEKRSGALSQEQDPSKMLFFLHVPRTAGKTYYTCFLKSAHPPSQRCARAYDRLRLNVSVPGCTLLSSHDDLSISDLFRPGGAVITQLRKPLDRVVSSYEFAIDVAVRHLHMEPHEVQDAKDDPSLTSTLGVWPWSQLVPWFMADMHARMAALKEAHDKKGLPRWLNFKDKQNRTYYWSKATNKSVWELPEPSSNLDPYNNPLVTPLHEWIELPVARELVHNTAALQILGLTNYSIWSEHEVGRRCVFEDPVTREVLQGVAQRRLVGMKHVGLTERLDESVLSLAASLGIKLSGPSYRYASAAAFSYDGEGVDESTPITYNSSYHGGNVTVTLQEARWRLKHLSARHVNVTEELRVNLPRLVGLVEKEDSWLDQQAAANRSSRRDISSSSSAGGGGMEKAAVGGVEGAAATSSKGEEVAGGVKGADGSQGPEGGEIEAGDEEEDSAGEEAAPRSSSSSSKGSKDTAEPGSEDSSGEGGNGDSSGEGDSEDTSGDAGSEERPTVPHRILKSSTKRNPKRRRRQAPTHPTGDKASKERQQQRIESPYAKEIEELDERVYQWQNEITYLEWDMWAIQVAGAVRSDDEALGPAKQILPDDHFLDRRTLGTNYKHCTSNTSKRHSSARRKVFRNLVTPTHESFSFSKRARRNIPRAVLDRIVELNSMDQELWELGERLLTAKLADQKAAGVLESFERPRPAQLQRQKDAETTVVGGGDSELQLPSQAGDSSSSIDGSSRSGGGSGSGGSSNGHGSSRSDGGGIEEAELDSLREEL